MDDLGMACWARCLLRTCSAGQAARRARRAEHAVLGTSCWARRAEQVEYVRSNWLARPRGQSQHARQARPARPKTDK